MHINISLIFFHEFSRAILKQIFFDQNYNTLNFIFFYNLF